jgi:hypothetical protein
MAITSGNDTSAKRKTMSPASGQPATQATAPAKPRRRRWLRFLGIGGTSTLALIALLPTIVAHTPLASWALRKAAPVKGSIAVRSVSLGWFSTPQVWGLEIHDPQNQPVLSVEHISAPGTLVNLILGRTASGTLLIEKPKLSLVFTANGSNLEETLATLLSSSTSASSTSTSTGTDLNLVVSDGEANVTDKPTGQSWHVTGLQVAMNASRKQAMPTKLEVSAALDGSQQPGSISLKFNAQPSAVTSKDAFSPAGLGQTDGDLTFAATNFPLAMVDRVVARAMPGMHLAGTLAAKANAQWTNLSKVKLDCDAAATHFELTSPWTGTDTLKLDSAHAAAQTARTDRQVTVPQLLFESDVGNCTASTQIDLGDAGWIALPTAFAQQQGKMQGTIDIAKLAQRLPATMRLRAGTQISSGQIQFSAQSSNAADGSGKVWQAQLQTSQLAAVDQGRPITWNQPIHAALNAHQSPQGIAIDQLTGDADFGKFSATGTFEQLTVTVSANLKQLADRLGQFVDLGGLALSGQTDGKLQWNHQPDGRFDSSGDIQIKSLLLSIPGQKPWNDDTMHVTFSARGITDFATRNRLDTAKVQLTSSVDSIGVSLLTPIAPVQKSDSVPFQVQWQGQLDKIAHRLPINVSLPMLLPTGNYQLLAQIAASRSALVVQQGRLALGQPSVTGTDWTVVQPSAEFGFSGRVDLTSGQLDLPSAQLSGVTRWQSATAYGLQIGPGELHSRLVNGVLQTDPLQVTCNQGQLSISPQVRINPGPLELKLSAGTLAQQVQFDPALCHSGMERIMPVLASVTQAQGVMSVQLQGARIPLLALDKTEAAGQIIVHTAQIQPGPLVQQLSLLSTSPISVAELKQGSVILFRVTGGRIYHQGLEMELSGLNVKTYGSVGFDDSLKMMAEVTVLPKLLGSLSAGGPGTAPISIPIGGSLNHPAIDKSEIARFTQAVFQQATQGVIQGQLGKQLDQFLSPRK